MMIPWFILLRARERLAVSFPFPVPFREQFRENYLGSGIESCENKATIVQPLISDPNAYDDIVLWLIDNFNLFFLLLSVLSRFRSSTAIAIASANKSDDAWEYLNRIREGFCCSINRGLPSLNALRNNFNAAHRGRLDEGNLNSRTWNFFVVVRTSRINNLRLSVGICFCAERRRTMRVYASIDALRLREQQNSLLSSASVTD